MTVRRAEEIAAAAFAVAATVPLAIGVLIVLTRPPPDPTCFEWCDLASGIGATLIGIGGVGLAWAAAIWWRQRWAQFLSVPACVIGAAFAAGMITRTRFQTEYLPLEIAVTVLAIALALSGLLTIYVLADWITARRSQ